MVFFPKSSLNFFVKLFNQSLCKTISITMCNKDGANKNKLIPSSGRQRLGLLDSIAYFGSILIPTCRRISQKNRRELKACSLQLHVMHQKTIVLDSTIHNILLYFISQFSKIYLQSIIYSRFRYVLRPFKLDNGFKCSFLEQMERFKRKVHICNTRILQYRQSEN